MIWSIIRLLQCFRSVKEEIRDATWIEPGKAVWFNAYNKKTGEMDETEAEEFLKQVIN